MRSFFCATILLGAALAGCMGTEPDKPKPVLTATSTPGTAYGDTLVGTRKQLEFTLRNSDAGFAKVETLTGIAIAATGTGVTLSHTCPTELKEGESCFITVAYKPAAPATLSGELRVTSNADPVALALSGTAVAALAQGAVAFEGDTSTDFSSIVGTPRPRTYTIRNLGDATDTLTITGPTETGWSFDNQCVDTLATKVACTVTVRFTPSATGPSVPSPVVVTDEYNKNYGALTLRPVGVGTN